jgi:hypothetical protein
MFEVPGMLALVRSPPSVRGQLLLGVEGALVVSFIILAVPLVFLSRRPRWWGKLLLPFCGIAWLFHAAVLPVFSSILSRRGVHIMGVWVPAMCGIVMFALAATHQIIDPKFSSSRPTLPRG